MELIDNNCHLKNSEAQASKVTYNCRSSSSQMNSNTKNKTEADVNLLLACKVQLSSEVIKWKTETLRLQKERDSVQQHNKELDQTVGTLSEKIKELQERLLQAEAESRGVQSRSMFVDQEKDALVQRLSQSFNKCHSFPFSERSLQLPHPKLHINELSSSSDWRESQLSHSRLHNEELSANEDWREVSQKMLLQMKKEMKELQEMSSRFCEEEEKVNVTNDTDVDCKEELKEGISSLMTETESLRHHLLEQRQKLHSLLLSVGPDEQLQIENLTTKTTVRCSEPAPKDTLNSVLKPKLKKTKKPNKFRMYFTKQLETFEDLNKVTREMSQFPGNGDEFNIKANGTHLRQSRISPTPVSSPAIVSAPKVCPICQDSFDVSQAEFEEHVMRHLEKESVSLLDQYVVL